MLTGAAGSGATTAAVQLAGERVAWCRVATGYDRAADVVAIAAASLGMEVEPAGRVLDLAGQLLDLLEADGSTLVLDDHHLVADPDVDRLLAEVAPLLPQGSRVIVTSESRPAGLIGLVPARDLVVLDAGDLAFDVAETERLLGRGGGSPEDAARWFTATRGWPVAVAAAEREPSAPAEGQLGPLLASLVDARPDLRPLVDLAACVPYVTGAVRAAVDSGLTDPGLAASSALFVDHAGQLAMVPAAADAWRQSMAPGRIAEIRRAAAAALAAVDPATSIELSLEAGRPEDAADTLADHLSEIGVERALTWLYRLPPELRRRFPPVLAAGQATVEVDVALAEANERVDRATTPEQRREALFGLGSVEAYRGELAAAATAFEAALRVAGGDPVFQASATPELATTRWLLGDLVGARAAMRSAPDSGRMQWLAAQLDVVDGIADEGTGRALGSDGDLGATGDGWTLAAAGLRSLHRHDLAAAGQQAASAYSVASREGGDVLAAAAPVHAWVALAEGRLDDASVVADELARRLGPRHRLGRVHEALIRVRVSGRRGDRARHERDLRRLRDLRATGYATIEQLVDAVLAAGEPDDSGAPTTDLVVRVLGRHEVVVRGRTIGRDGWKSKKALEVLTVLALSERGVLRERVVEDIWPSRDPEKGRTLLRTALSDIRRLLEPDRPAGEPSSFVETREDLLRVDGSTDLDQAEASSGSSPVEAFDRLRPGLAPEVAATEWGHELGARVDRAVTSAAAAIAGDRSVESGRRVHALEALIAAEPWQRSHYDALAELHRDEGDADAAADVERRWFADD